jgi:hypothetical protein
MVWGNRFLVLIFINPFLIEAISVDMVLILSCSPTFQPAIAPLQAGVGNGGLGFTLPIMCRLFKALHF